LIVFTPESLVPGSLTPNSSVEQATSVPLVTRIITTFYSHTKAVGPLPAPIDGFINSLFDPASWLLFPHGV
jgi:hypothetical protein